MSAVSSLPIELWHKILRLTCEVSLSSDILPQDYPWVDTKHLAKRRATAYVHERGAMIWIIAQVCRSWNEFAVQLGYQEIGLADPFSCSFHELLMEHQSCSSIFSETRRFTVRVPWMDTTRDLLLLVQSMPRLEWLQLSTHEMEESHLHTWLPSILEAQPCLLHLDVHPLHFSDTLFMDPECISVISGLAIRLRRLTCAIKYVPRSGGQEGHHAPRFQHLEVLQMTYIHCDSDHEEAAREWFSKWHLPSLKQFHIPLSWKYLTKLLDEGLGAQLEVLDASAHIIIPKKLWLLCPRVHTIISGRVLLLPEARPRLHYIFVYPFRRRATPVGEIMLKSLLTSLLCMWDDRESVNGEYTFSLQNTGLSWKSWAKTSVSSTLLNWKSFAEEQQIEVLDGYGVDIRDVTLLSEGLDD